MLSMDVAPSRIARGIKLSVGETRIGAPRRGCRGLTQVEFDPQVWRVPRALARRAQKDEAEPAAEQKRPKRASAVVPGKKTIRFRCRAPTGRSSAASRMAGCSRSRA